MVVSTRSRARLAGDSAGRRVVALSLPVLIPLAMTATFAVTKERLGHTGGYIAGFGLYWGACAVASLGLLGRDDVRRVLRDGRPRLPLPAVAGAALLMWPPVGAIATRFVPEIRSASAQMIATIAGVAVVNAVLEELLWRGVYIALWPDNPWLGWVWPAVGFGAWHLAPQVVNPAAVGPLVYVVSATALGLSWGWIAWRTKSIRWTTVAHLFTDASGIRNASFFLGG